MKKILSMLALVSMLLSVFAATAAADDFTYPMDPITLTINGSKAGGSDTYDDSKVVEWARDIYAAKVIRDMTGVSVEDVGGGEAGVTLSEEFLLMLASGDLPDIIIANWHAYSAGLDASIDEGYVIDLMEYAEYLPNLMKYLEEHPEIAAQAKTDNGRLPAAPYISHSYPFMGMVIRQDWLDAQNLAAPETIEELHDVLAAFKAAYPECSAPLTFESRFLFLQYAGTTLSNAWNTAYTDYVIDGEVKFGPMTPEYKAFIQTLADWYQEGLIDTDFASVDKSTVQAKFSNGESGVAMQMQSNIANCVAANAGTDYAVSGLKSMVINKGDEPRMCHYNATFNGSWGWGVSSTCENIEAACRYIDWRYSEEGMMVMNYGIEGVTYNIVDGEVKLTDLIMNNPDTPNPTNARQTVTAYTNTAGVQLNGYIEYDEARMALVEQWKAPMVEYALPTLTYTIEQQEAISGNWNDINSYCQEMILKFVIGAEDMANWDKFVQTLQSMGIDEVLNAKQEAYDTYVAKMENITK